MTELPGAYLEYPRRRYGMDHDRYAWSNLFDRPKVNWPNGARVVLPEYFRLQNDGKKNQWVVAKPTEVPA